MILLRSGTERTRTSMKKDIQPAETNRILLNTRMIADDLDDLQWSYIINDSDAEPGFKGFALYNGQADLHKDIIYVLKSGDAKVFPVNHFAYICTDNVKGKAPHIRNIKQNRIDDVDVINAIVAIFDRYHQFEASINNVIVNEGTLDDLCRIGCNFFRNPMYIHDNMFTVIALPKYVEGMLKFEKTKTSNNIHIPLWLINDFKYDEAYQETLTRKHASIWGIDQYPRTMRSLYVNLWEGNYYLGRLLINELESTIKPGQFILAEIFAEYIKLIMRRDLLSPNKHYRDYEDTVRTILRGETADKRDLDEFLQILNWDKNDRYICIKMQSQDPTILIKSDSALRSQISSMFAGSFDFFHEQKLCLIINATKSGTDMESIKSALAPLVRESVMYCGISNPVNGVFNLRTGFDQTDWVLEYIGQKKEHWLMMFGECFLSYMLNITSKTMPAESLVSSRLLNLIRIDEEKNTEYARTLRCYLKNERSIPKTSEELIIHRTTLQYRLQKIEELTKFDLDNENTRLYLLLSYKYLEQSDGLI